MRWRIHSSLMPVAVLVWVGETRELPGSEADQLRSQALQHFSPLPKSMPGAEDDTKALRRLGRKLYFDKQLSASGEVSCHTCHALESNRNGYEQADIPEALVKADGRNSPTVLNAGLHFAQFWDGRAPDLEEQAKVPMLNPQEMGMSNPEEMLERLRNNWSYRRRFRQVFAEETDPVSIDNVAQAIAAYERTLITRDRFDDFLQGDDKALRRDELRGLATFLATGCQQCHDGALLGGNSFKRMGIYHAYANTNDPGREQVTGVEMDRHKFKVPSLRNVALTGPYFHDGKVTSLDEAVRQMAYLQLNQELSMEDVNLIVAFLKTLSDKKLLVNTPKVPPRALEQSSR